MWEMGEVDGYKYEAKVYEVGSKFGIKKGRVSKLWICNPRLSKGDKDYVVYNYDRGLDFDHAPKGLVKKILALYPEQEG